MKIRKRIARVTDDLRKLGLRLAFARDRWARCHDIAAKAHERAVELGKKADQARAKQPKRARRFDRRANRKRRRSVRAAAKAQDWVGRIKVFHQEKFELLRTKAELEADLAEWKRKHKVTIRGNKVTGGTRAQRLGACARASAAACASGRRANFYSQPGRYDVDHCITGEDRGERSDCSQWFTSVYRSCGLKDPNGTDWGWGYTGTLASHGKQISRAEARRTPGAAVLWPGHVELALGDGTERTIGHGSAPIDYGTFDLLPNPQFRKYV